MVQLPMLALPHHPVPTTHPQARVQKKQRPGDPALTSPAFEQELLERALIAVKEKLASTELQLKSEQQTSTILGQRVRLLEAEVTKHLASKHLNPPPSSTPASSCCSHTLLPVMSNLSSQLVSLQAALLPRDPVHPWRSESAQQAPAEVQGLQPPPTPAGVQGLQWPPPAPEVQGPQGPPPAPAGVQGLQGPPPASAEVQGLQGPPPAPAGVPGLQGPPPAIQRRPLMSLRPSPFHLARATCQPSQPPSQLTSEDIVHLETQLAALHPLHPAPPALSPPEPGAKAAPRHRGPRLRTGRQPAPTRRSRSHSLPSTLASLNC